MSTLRRYLRVQAMTFVFGIVGPIFLAVYFTAQPDPTLRWMYWWGLFITTADILIALAIVTRRCAQNAVTTSRPSKRPPGRADRRGALRRRHRVRRSRRLSCRLRPVAP